MLDLRYLNSGHHRSVIQSIERGAPGHAQAVINGALVSYVTWPLPIVTFDGDVVGRGEPLREDRLLDEIFVDIARPKPRHGAMASAHTFSRARVKSLAARLALGDDAAQEAALDLHCFYLDRSAVGTLYLRD